MLKWLGLEAMKGEQTIELPSQMPFIEVSMR
jgi:hypothetical protein